MTVSDTRKQMFLWSAG